MRIALAGNPNSGKTTMYNALTGRNEKIGNWAGVTVDKKEHLIKKEYVDGNENIIAVDLPGAYSMSPFTSEESITSNYVRKENPDCIINIVDATNISRSLFFTTQLLELGIPVVVALNKSDINEKNETLINEKVLSEKLHCPVIKTVSTEKNGLKEVVKAAISLAGSNQLAPFTQGDIDLTNKDEVEKADRKRFEFVKGLSESAEKRKHFTMIRRSIDKIDDIVTHPVLGLLIFALIMYMVFYISQASLGTWLANILAGWIDAFKDFAASMVEGANPVLYAILIDGIIGGVGSVVGFLPLVMVMYFLIALLEDCGYMARATVVLDPIFKRVGLSGKSVIPMVIGTGCGIPAIMACRTIKNERERRTTAMLATFMPCGAKLPVIALFAGVFFPESKWVGPLMYFTGILLILLGALLIKEIMGVKYRKSFFIIELPDYKVPSLKLAFTSMIERGKAYIVKAGTIILVCNTVVQMMQSFTLNFEVVEEGMEGSSILAFIAYPFSVLLVPIIGIASWQLASASITGFIAKENVVGTIATCFAITNFIDTEALELMEGSSEVAAIMGISKIAALAYLMFNLFTPPCFAALGAMNSEMQSRKWFYGALAFQLSIGYTIGFLVYQIGNIIANGSVGEGFIGGLVFVLLFVFVCVGLIVRGRRRIVEEYSLQK